MSNITTQSNVERVQELYDAFDSGDMETMMAGWSDDITWVEMEGGPFAGTYTGPESVVQGVFEPVAEDWSEFSLEDREYIDAGDVVVVTGTINATANESDEHVEAAFAHVITLEDGLVTRFVEYADTYLLQQAL